MKLTVIPSDGAVYVDGVFYLELFINAPVDVHALQWMTTNGWIEYVNNSDGTKPQNKSITELPDWALAAKTKWDEAKAANEAAIAAATALAQNQPTTQGTQTL